MFKLPNGIPTLRTSAQDWADYAEWSAIIKGQISLLDLIKPSLLLSDEEVVNGVEDDTDNYLIKVDEISEEIIQRIKLADKLYPFLLQNKGYNLIYKPESHTSSVLYPYLLMATRSNMGKDRIQASIDGALLFESLCSLVAKNYFGERADVDVLGTSRNEVKNFRDKLREVIRKIGEGGNVHENEGYRPQDDKVDVIVWKGFRDQQPSKIIAFGQCKTGTSWVDNLSELDTVAFCKNWFSIQPVLTPLRMFFTAQYFPRDLFRVRANTAGLVFDRFRILDYLPDRIEQEILEKMEAWAVGIKNFYLN